MPISARLRSAFQRRATEESVTPVAVNATESKTDPSPEAGQPTEMTNAEDRRPSEDAQQGVQDVEAVTLTWTKGTLIAVFVKYGCLMIEFC